MGNEQRKKRILVVDDDEDFTRIVKLNLERTGKYEVATENKGGQSLSAAKTFMPNLILLDVSMVDMQGGDAAYQLRSDESTKDIPIIFLTGLAKKEDVEKSGGIIGGHRFLAKPVSNEELIACIEQNMK